MCPNGNVFLDRVLIPRAEDILMMDETEIERIEETTLDKGEELSREDNIFTSLLSTVQTYAQVRNVHKKVLRDRESACANNNILTYRFKDALGKVK